MSYLDLCGYVFDEKAIQSFVDRGLTSQIMQSAPSAKGMEAFQWEIEELLTGKVRDPHNQGIGDCVSQGATGAVEDLEFWEMLMDPTLKFMPLSSEVMYGLARVQVGRGGCGYGDGAIVAWALEAMKSIGVLARGVYGKWDLTTYNSKIAKQFGDPRNGAPTELADLCKANLVLNVELLVPSRNGPSVYEQARDIIASKGTIVTGSNQLFGESRDAQGFCSRGGRGGHCTYYRGVSDNSRRPGIVYQQSWGNNMPSQGAQKITLPSGREITLPKGAFFIDATQFDAMHNGGGNEVWAITRGTSWAKPDSEVSFMFYLPDGKTLKYATAA